MSYDKRMWALLTVVEVVGYGAISYACAAAWQDDLQFLMYGYFGIQDYTVSNSALVLLGVTPGVNLLGLVLGLFIVVSILLF